MRNLWKVRGRLAMMQGQKDSSKYFSKKRRKEKKKEWLNGRCTYTLTSACCTRGICRARFVSCQLSFWSGREGCCLFFCTAFFCVCACSLQLFLLLGLHLRVRKLFSLFQLPLTDECLPLMRRRQHQVRTHQRFWKHSGVFQILLSPEKRRKRRREIKK